MTNLEKAKAAFGFNPFATCYSINPVQYYGPTGTQQYGPIWLLEVGGEYYNFSEWQRSKAGKLPEHVYYYDPTDCWWKLQE